MNPIKIYRSGKPHVITANPWITARNAMCDEIVTARNAYESNQATIKALTEALSEIHYSAEYRAETGMDEILEKIVSISGEALKKAVQV